MFYRSCKKVQLPNPASLCDVLPQLQKVQLPNPASLCDVLLQLQKVQLPNPSSECDALVITWTLANICDITPVNIF